jgi:CRISPR-associated protein Csm3
MKLFSKKIIRYTLELKTGLHIGAGKESVEIGGIDLPVVRRKDNYAPYIPGSSLKGKIRSLLQLAAGELEHGGDPSAIRNLFGNAGSKVDSKNRHSSRLLVRDIFLKNDSFEKLKDSEFNDMPFTEVKFENTIDRNTGVSKSGLRQIERVPAGSIFEGEFVINVMNIPDGNKTAEVLEKEYSSLLAEGINLLNHDYLGGHGSRGYGQVLLTIQKEENITL